MDTLECIKGRRSVRRFTGEAVTKDDVLKVVESARFAPTWKNSQTVRYIAVLDAAVKDRIAAEGLGGFAWNAQIIGGAPALVLVTTIDGMCGYEKDGSFSTSKGTHWQSFDAGLAAEAFCLAAHEAGLGTVIMGIYDEAAVKRIAGVPEGQSVSALIAIGHPSETPAPRPRLSAGELLSVR